MKLSSKIKYAAAGALTAVVLVPLIVQAAKTIPLTMKEGDVVSASVLNALFSRVNDVTTGFASVDELDGTWSCTTYSTNSPGCVAAGNLLYKKTGVMTFTASNKTFSYSGTGDPRGCFVGGYQTSGNYDVQSGFLITDYGVYDARKRGAYEFLWTLNSANPPNGFTVCTKTNIPPNPPDNLAASVATSNVNLTWSDQSSDESGFKIERKTSSTGAWTLVSTASANATSYTDSGLTAGTYWYRVIATNNYGDAMSSSEVQAVVQ